MEKGLKLTRDDRELLRTLRIDPEPTVQEVMFDEMSRPMDHSPTKVAISSGLARAIIKEFGELTFETWWAYLRKYQA